MGDFSCKGNLGADPELTFLPSGQAMAKFSVAETERIRNKDTNEWSDGDTTWWRCTAFGTIGEQIAENIQKGTAVWVKGRIKIRQYDKDGVTQYSTEVVVDDLGLDVRRIKPKGESTRSGDYDARPPF